MYEETAGARNAPPGCRGRCRGAANGPRRGREGGIEQEGAGKARGGDRRRASHGSRGRGRENSNRECCKKEASQVSGRGRLNLILPLWEVDQLSFVWPSARSDLLKKTCSHFFFVFIVVVAVVELRYAQSSIWGCHCHRGESSVSRRLNKPKCKRCSFPRPRRPLVAYVPSLFHHQRCIIPPALSLVPNPQTNFPPPRHQHTTPALTLKSRTGPFQIHHTHFLTLVLPRHHTP
jgi:hypothetical protein